MSHFATRRVQPRPGSGLDQDLSGTGHDIKEEPEELTIGQDEEHLPVFVQVEESMENITSEAHFHSRTERDTGHKDDDWETFSCSSAQLATDAAANYNQVQIRDRRTTTEKSALLLYQSASEKRTTANDADTPGTDQVSERKKLECPFCQKRFDCKMNLKRHIRVHTGERPYSCPTCQKTFTYKGNLVAHSRVHTGEKPFSCSVCNNTFTHRFSLKEHMKTHTNEKPYSCSFCEKTFAHKGNLTTHMRIHTNEKPYRCSLCEKSFALKNTLDIHTRQHTGEKPYKCSLCDKDFYQSSHLHKHMRRNHTNKSKS